MTKRKVLAAATLTAGPQWAYFWGMEGEEAAMFGAASAIGCAFFGPFGAAACGITGVA